MNETEQLPPILKALRSSITMLRWLLLALLLVYLASNFRIVGPNESGLVMRFGRLTERVHPPGILLALPPPIDEVFVVPTRSVSVIELDEWVAGERKESTVEAVDTIDAGDDPLTLLEALNAADAAELKADMLHPVRNGYGLTGDVNVIHARFSVHYSISDPRAFVLKVRDLEKALRPLLLQAAGFAARQMPVDEILTSGRDRFRMNCEEYAQERIDRLGLGISIRAWETREIVPASQVQAAFEDVTSAKVEARTLVERAETYRQSILPQARADAYRTVQESTGEAASQVAKAQGTAAAFLAKLKVADESPYAFRTQQFNETLEAVLENTRIPAIDATRRKGVRIMMGGIQ